MNLLDNLLDPLNVYLVNQIVGDLEELEEDVLNQPNENVPFVGTDPFETLSGNQFQKVYRLNKPLVRNLIELLQPYMRPPRNEYSLSITIRVIIKYSAFYIDFFTISSIFQVLMALHFYASGSYQAITATNMFYGVSQSSMGKALLEVTLALNQPNIFDNWVLFPRNIQELNSLSQRLVHITH